jgi:hypothetical protein
MIINVLLGLGAVVLAGWFWLHCARPCLVAFGARPVALQIVLAISVLLGAANLVWLGSLVSHVGRSVAWWALMATFLAWIIVVGLGFLNSYKFLIRLTGGRDKWTALPYAVWEIRAALVDVGTQQPTPRSVQRVRRAMSDLDALRTDQTSTLVDLWLDAARLFIGEALLHGPVEDLNAALTAETRRLWPTAEAESQ